MAASNFVHDGNSIDHTPSGAIAAGDVVVQNDLVGIAVKAIAASALGALAVAGVFAMPKATTTSSAIAVGKDVYWDDTNDVVTETVTGNTYVGKTVVAAVDADATVRVRLSQ